MTELINLELKSLNLGQEITSDSTDNVAVTKKYVDDVIASEIIGVATDNENFDTIDLELKALGDLLNTNTNDIGDVDNPQGQAGTLVATTTSLTVKRKSDIADLQQLRASQINSFAGDINTRITQAENALFDTGVAVIAEQNVTINNSLAPITQEHTIQQNEVTTLFNERRQVVGHKEIICGAGEGMGALQMIYQDPEVPLQSADHAFNNRLDSWDGPGGMNGYFSGKNTQPKSLTLEFTEARVCTEMHFWNNPEHWGSYTENGVEGEDYSVLHETPKEIEIYGTNYRHSSDTTESIIAGNLGYVLLASFDNTADSYPYTKHVRDGFVSDNLNLAKVFKLNNTTAYKFYTIVVKSIIRVNSVHDYNEVEGLYDWCWSASEIAFIGDEISQSTIRAAINESVQDRKDAVAQHLSDHEVVLDVGKKQVHVLTEARKEDLQTSRSFLGADIPLDLFTNVSSGADVVTGPTTSVFAGSNLTHAFDGATGQYPSCIVLTPDPVTNFATLDINCGQGLQRELGRVAMWSRTDTKNENPSIVIIRGSNDNSVFTTLYSNEDTPFVMEDYPNTSETPSDSTPVPVSDLTDKSLDLMIENPAPYQYYQIQMKGMGFDGNWRVGIGELGLYERSVHDDVVAERYFRNEAVAVLETGISNLEDVTPGISSYLDTTRADRISALADISSDISDLTDGRGNSILSTSIDIGNMVSSREDVMTSVTNNLNTAIQERNSEITALTNSRIDEITNVEETLISKTDIIEDKLQAITETFATQHSIHTANISSLVTDRQSDEGSFAPVGDAISALTSGRKAVINTTISHLDESRVDVQEDLDNFNNNKLDKSGNYSGGEYQSFKIDEDAYLYIGKHWRIAANNINQSNRKLEFEYSPDTINWILGAPLFNFDKGV